MEFDWIASCGILGLSTAIMLVTLTGIVTVILLKKILYCFVQMFFTVVECTETMVALLNARKEIDPHEWLLMASRYDRPSILLWRRNLCKGDQEKT